MAETFTTNYGLSKFDQGDNPPILTAAKLNANLDAIDTQIKNRDTFDRFAATRVVDPAGAGTHTTLAAALASLPVTGGTIFMKGGAYAFSAGLTVPANVRIVGAGRSSTILNMTGAFTLFTTSGGYFCLSEVTVQGDDTTAQIVFNTDHDVDVQCSDFKQVYGIVEAVSSATEVSMTDCYVILSASAGSGIFLWRGATGGTLRWNYVHMTAPVVSASLVEGPTGGSAGCNWKVVQSYTGAPPPVVSNFYHLNSVDWLNFDVDFAKISIYSNTNKIVGCDFASCFLRLAPAGASKTLISGCKFELGGDDFGLWVAQLVIGPSTSEVAVTGCQFRGNGVSFRGVYVYNSSDVTISGCTFGSHTSAGVQLESSTPASEAVVTGCTFYEPVPVYEGDTNCFGVYSGNVGFKGSIIVGTRSTVDADNFRNVRTYGAVGDGVTNDTVAIQAASDSLPTDDGGVLFFPPGTYKTTSAITLPSNATSVRGSGDSSAIDISSGSFAAFTVPSGLAVRKKYSIVDLKIVGGGDGVATPVGGALVGATLNDTFASAPSITGGNGTFSAGSTTGFTKEGGEPNHGVPSNAGGKSGWLEWTAPASGTCTIDLSGSSFDTLLSIYTGVSVGALTLIAGDDDSGAGSTSLVAFSAVMGTSYKIAVDGFGGASGSVTFTMTLVAGAAATNNNIVSVTDSLSLAEVSLERVNSYAVRTPLKVTDGSVTPVIISAIDCYFQQVDTDGQSLLCDNGPSFPDVNLSLVRVDFYRTYGSSTVGGAFAAGEYLSGFSNINLMATDCHFLISIGCSLGALNLTNCEVANWTPGNNPVIYVEDDSYASIESAVTGCRLSFVNFDVNGTGTRFEGCYLDSCHIKDNAISGIENCYFTGSVTASSTIIGSGDTSIVGCHFASGTNGTDYTIDDPGYVSACFIGTGAPTANIRVPSGAAIIVGCSIGVGGGVTSILETGSGGNSRYSDNLYTIGPVLGTTSATQLQGVRKFAATSVAAGASYVLQFTASNELGNWCVGTIKNVGANPLTVKETVTDQFGVTDSVEQIVAGSADAPLSSLINLATARPPYSSYTIEVKHNGAATTFSMRVSQTGAY